MRSIPLFIFVLSFLHGFSQYDPNQKPNTYRSKDNPYYWKNKLPKAGYWQQDVHYTIKAFIDDTNDVIRCSEYKLVYWNNSPNVLNELYFHLYQNSFQPCSHMHNLYKHNGQKITFSEQEKKKLNTKVYDIKVNGEKVDTIHDFSVMKVMLNEPLQSGDSAVITLTFDTYMERGSMRSRMKTYPSHGQKHFNGVHWYPAICVYDRKFGWTTEQHLDKEFYNNFGAFDLELTFPQEYIVEATGNLLNREEVLPDDLFKKLQISNFKYKAFGSAPSIIIPREEGKTKTWKYHAENVHNVVFTANPNYRIDEQEWNGIKIIALAEEQHASKWQESARFTKKVIATYHTDFTEYIWPKIIVADANDGMEYPMITLDGGTYPQHQALLAHEVGHMWFYGMVGTNETYRAFMDEGFTQFLTAWSLEKVTGNKGTKAHAKSKWIDKRLDTLEYRYGSWYYAYLKYAKLGYDYPLNTHSSGFRGAIRHGGGYGLVYYKTAVMLDNLRYTLGDELFLEAIQYYVRQWKCAHPYPEDFRQAIIDYTHVDLNWFFDQWLETTKKINYAIEKVKKGEEKGTYILHFKRKGQMQMPIDFVVKDTRGKSYHYHIPNTWFVKKTDATVLPKWYGWDKNLNPTYEAKIKIDAHIWSVEIDPSNTLADIDELDNQWPTKNIQIRFDHHVKSIPDRKKVHLNLRPDIWYNTYDGLQIGLHANTNYMKELYVSDFTLWRNTGIGQGNVASRNKKKHQKYGLMTSGTTSLYFIWDQLYLNSHLYHNAGLVKHGYQFEKIFRRQDARQPEYTRVYFGYTFMERFKSQYSEYLLYPDLWTIGQANNWVTFGAEKRYDYSGGFGVLRLENRASNGDLNYGFHEIEAKNTKKLGRLKLKTRVYGRYGQKDIPVESALYLAGNNPEGLYDNKYTRASGFVPNDWTGFGNNTNHFQMGGGLNLRGFSGVALSKDTIVTSYGSSGAAFNMELEFDKAIKVKSRKLQDYFHFDAYLFGDIGALTYQKEDDKQLFDQLRWDAGLGTALTIKFGRYLDINPIVLRFDMPLYVNANLAGHDNFAYRYVVGLNRAF